MLGFTNDVWIFRMVMPNVEAATPLRTYGLYKVQLSPKPVSNGLVAPATTPNLPSTFRQLNSNGEASGNGLATAAELVGLYLGGEFPRFVSPYRPQSHRFRFVISEPPANS